MTKFKRVLSDAELISATFKAEVEGTMGELRAVEQAVLAKLAEQDPVAYVSSESFSSDGTSDIMSKNLKIGTRLYAHPMPTISGERKEALEKVLEVVQAYLPPDGIDAKDAINHIVGLVDPMPCVSTVSDKPACDLQNEKYETQIPDGTLTNEGTSGVQNQQAQSQATQNYQADTSGMGDMDNDTPFNAYFARNAYVI